MNVLLWVFQIVLALWNLVGGIYVVNNYGKIANGWALDAMPKAGWLILGGLQIVFAIALILPVKKVRKLTSVAGACLAILSLFGIGLYFQYAGFPGMLWGLIPAVLAGFVAYKRWGNPIA